MDFKGTKGKWKLKTFPQGQMSVRNENDTRKICVSRVNNYEESLHNLLLMSKAQELLEKVKELTSKLRCTTEYEVGVESFKQIVKESEQLIKESTEL